MWCHTNTIRPVADSQLIESITSMTSRDMLFYGWLANAARITLSRSRKVAKSSQPAKGMRIYPQVCVSAIILITWPESQHMRVFQLLPDIVRSAETQYTAYATRLVLVLQAGQRCKPIQHAPRGYRLAGNQLQGAFLMLLCPDGHCSKPAVDWIISTPGDES